MATEQTPEKQKVLQSLILDVADRIASLAENVMEDDEHKRGLIFGTFAGQLFLDCNDDLHEIMIILEANGYAALAARVEREFDELHGIFTGFDGFIAKPPDPPNGVDDIKLWNHAKNCVSGSAMAFAETLQTIAELTDSPRENAKAASEDEHGTQVRAGGTAGRDAAKLREIAAAFRKCLDFSGQDKPAANPIIERRKVILAGMDLAAKNLKLLYRCREAYGCTKHMQASINEFAAWAAMTTEQKIRFVNHSGGDIQATEKFAGYFAAGGAKELERWAEEAERTEIADVEADLKADLQANPPVGGGDDGTPRKRGKRPMTPERKAECRKHYDEWEKFYVDWKADSKKGSARKAFAEKKLLPQRESDAMIRSGTPEDKKKSRKSRRKSHG